PNALLAFPIPSSTAIECNSDSSVPGATDTKRKRFSGKSKKRFWAIKLTKFLTLSGLTLLLQAGTSSKDLGGLGYACQQESHHLKQKTPDSFLGMAARTRFSAFEVPLSLAEAVPNRVDAAE